MSEVLREVGDSMALAESIASEPIRIPSRAVGPVVERPVLERAAGSAHPRGIEGRVAVAGVAA